MRRFSFRASLVLLIACLALAAQPLWAQNAGRKPNIVFILADDLGWRDTSLYGSTFLQTPNVEKLAQRGMMFTSAYSANPLCSPTRASILTGLYPARIGITTPACHVPQVVLMQSIAKQGPPHHKALQADSVTRLKTEYFTLPEALKQAEYATGHFGKWHLGAEPYSPLQQGFDVDLPHWPGPGPAGSFVAPWKFPASLNFTGQPGEHIEDRMASEAIKFIKANKDKPFFLNYWCFSVHAPFDGKKELIETYRAKADPANPQRCPVYGAMVQSMDEAVGRLMATLDELGIAQDTIVVFFSDNGGNMYDRVEGITPTSNAPLRGGKANIYEGGVRVPCIVVWPGVTKAGARNDQAICSVDFYPTILEMLGLKPQTGQSFDGTSIVPVLKGGAIGREAIFCHFPHYVPATGNKPCTSVRKGDWKLIRFYCDNPDQTDLLELYNLKDDVGEMKNLAAQEPQRVKEMNAMIDTFLSDTGAAVPKRNPAYDPKAPVPAPGKPAPRAKKK